MIKSIPFKPGHLDLVSLSSVHDGDETIISDYENGLVAMTFIETIIETDTNQVLGVMNGILIHKKCMEVCMLVAKASENHPIGFTKHVARSLASYADELKLTRVQTTIREGFIHLVKWMRVLGFKQEALLKSWGPEGDDYSLYVRFYNER